MNKAYDRNVGDPASRKFSKPKTEAVSLNGVTSRHFVYQHAIVAPGIIEARGEPNEWRLLHPSPELIGAGLRHVEKTKPRALSHRRPRVHEGRLGEKVHLVASQQELSKKQRICRGHTSSLL